MSIKITPDARADARALFERSFKDKAAFDGDKQPKQDASSAKRTATALQTTADSWRLRDVLQPEQVLALHAAIRTMRHLAATLDDVAILAREHHKACEEARKREQAEREAARARTLDELALNRWGSNDEAALAEASELAHFLDGEYGTAGLARAAWARARWGVPAATSVLAPDEVSNLESYKRLTTVLARHSEQPTVESLRAARRLAAGYLLALDGGSAADRAADARWAMRRLSRADYDAWRAERAIGELGRTTL